MTGLGRHIGGGVEVTTQEHAELTLEGALEQNEPNVGMVVAVLVLLV